MKTKLTLILLGCVLAFSTAPVAAQAPAPVERKLKPTEAVAASTCADAGCHENVKQHRVLHGPVNVDGCEACHTLVDAKTHTWKLAREQAELCGFCHQVDLRNMPVVHKPLLDGDCSGCHDPHGGRTAQFTRGNSTREMCSRCHEDVVANKKNVHGPIAADACDSCHTAHGGQFPNLLSAQGNDLCFTCHAEMKTQMTKVKFTHKAVEQDCNACHDPHASNFTMQIKQQPVDLCISCHANVGKDALAADHKHSVVTSDQGCLNCHTAHGGNLAALMKKEPIDVCMSCHNQQVKTPTGRTVASVAEVKDPKLVKHGPIRDGNCSGCHNTHGSQVARLLVKPYPETFYQPFSQEKYELCFTCHDQQLVELPETAGLTNFRNGESNLHYIHVNREKGRNCRACHNAHASPNELHVRDSVPFGNWEMPIKFTKTDTGGTCSPGCHKPFDYDREKPVSYDAASTAIAKDGAQP
jgi:predicted CXXCH cytochrome family protein